MGVALLIWLAVLAVMNALEIVLAAMLWRRSAGTETSQLPAATAAGEKKADPMDEGFENLMRYSVMGHTGLEAEEGE